MQNRIQLIREAAERLNTQPLEARTEQPLPFEKTKAKKEEIHTPQPNNIAYIGKNGRKPMYRTYGHFANIGMMIETHGMTSIQGEHSYRRD